MTTGRLRWGGNCGPILDRAPWDMPDTINRWLEAVYPADRLTVREGLDDFLATRQSIRTAYRLLHPDGAARLVAGYTAFVADTTIVGSVVRAGGATGPVREVAATDEDWSAVGYPARSDPELVQFFDLSGDMLCIAGLDGFFRRASPNFARCSGTRPRKSWHTFVDFVHPDDRPPRATP